MRVFLVIVVLLLSRPAEAQINDPLEFSQKKLAKLVNKPFPASPANDRSFPLNSLLKDKVTLVNFWFVGCFSCMEELPYLNALIDSINSEQFQVVSFARNTKEELDNYFSDTTDYHLKLVRKLNNNQFKYAAYPCCTEKVEETRKGNCILLDHLGIIMFPTSLIIDKKGIVRNFQIGFRAPEKSIKDGKLFKEEDVKMDFQNLKGQIEALLLE